MFVQVFHVRISISGWWFSMSAFSFLQIWTISFAIISYLPVFMPDQRFQELVLSTVLLFPERSQRNMLWYNSSPAIFQVLLFPWIFPAQPCVISVNHFDVWLGNHIGWTVSQLSNSYPPLPQESNFNCKCNYQDAALMTWWQLLFISSRTSFSHFVSGHRISLALAL